jgi:7,8-dihydropterin-6-yl-methyl-4-(beta-D-ribofuranosyl)aminobenzene 5'-phosphate synthase
MKVTIIYDNTVYKKGLRADWGFSCLVEVKNTSPVLKRILFDTGANGSILLSNMKKLGIDPKSIDEVFISHAHFDHTGGLSAFLEENNKVKVYVPVSFRGVRGVKEVITINEPLQIHENVFSTGELDGMEQSMAVKTDMGLVIIAGCSHPEMAHILDAVSPFGKVYAIIGGLHGFREYDLFRDLEVICPTHCTQHIAEIRSLYPEKYIEGGAGRIIELN